jgi:DNA-binding PadR family transcriptional regulator
MHTVPLPDGGVVVRKPWFYILLSLASSDRYGSDIQEDVHSLSKGEVRLWPATLYGSLEELAAKRWIRELGPPEEPGSAAGRSRWYRITREGRAALVDEVERREALARVARGRLAKGGA